MRKKILQFACVLLLSAATTLWSQAVNGTLTGRVTTTDGSGIANAAVTIVNVKTNGVQKVLTGPDGSFTVSGLPPGTYRIDVETAGFKRTSQQNVVLTAPGTVTINITMVVGNMNETVEIRGRTPMVQTDGGEVSQSLGMRTLQELPVIDRNVQQLNELQTGITPPEIPYSPAVDPERNRSFSTNGQSPAINLNVYDGVNNLERFRGTAIRVIPEEATQQMNIETANLVPSRGFTGGSVTSNVMRGGTNNWHGEGFWFWSGNIINSRNFFMAPDVPTPRLVYNQPGVAFGGPVKKDHIFFFGSYEGNFNQGSQSQLTTVPIPQALTGNFSGIPGVTVYNPATGTAAGVGRTPFFGNVIPGGAINPTAAAVASFFPTPNLPGFVNNYSVVTPFRNNWQKADVRVDDRFNDRTSLFLRYGFSNAFAYDNSPLGPVIGSGQQGHVLANNAAVDLAHSFGARWISDLRLSYNRYDQHLSFLGNQGPLAGDLGLNPSTFTNGSLVGVNIAGLAPLAGAAYLPSNPIDNNYNIVWAWSYHTSRHNVTFGTDMRQYRVSGFTDNYLGSQFGPFGTAYFGPGTTLANNGLPLETNSVLYNSLASFLLGQPNQIGMSNYLGTPAVRQEQYSFWLGDRVQFWRRFTFDIGLRYELYSPLDTLHGNGFQFYNPTTNTFTFSNLHGVNNDIGVWNQYDLAPRIGLAFRFNDKTVIRGGYAIQYFQPPFNQMPLSPITFGFAAGTQNTYNAAALVNPFGLTLPGTTPPLLTNGLMGTNLPQAVTPNSQPSPYVQTFSLQVQRDFYWGTMLSVGYVGTLGRNLPYFENLNAALPGTGIAGLPFEGNGQTTPVLFYGNGMSNNYNSLQATLNKRFARDGLAFAASYTYSKALGYTAENGMLLNPFNLHQNYGPLDYDQQSVLHLSHLWELPFGHYGNSWKETLLGGWQLNGILTYASGTPITVTANPLLCNCPGNTVLANAVGAPFIQNTGLQYLNPAAFAAPGADSFGTLNRGFVRGPGYTQYDMSLMKHFKFHDRFDFELRGEAYNLTNSPHFVNPIADVSSPGFGQFYSTNMEGAFGRQVNLGLRVRF